jgi:hypothetical protein
MGRKRKKPAKRAAKKSGKGGGPPQEKANRQGAEAPEEPPKKRSGPLDRAFWVLLIALAIYLVSGRLVTRFEDPWAGILEVTQIVSAVIFGLTLVVMIVLFFRAYPHPLRALNRKLAVERENLRKENKRKKGKRGKRG